MKKLIATLLILPILAVAQQPPPPGISSMTVPFRIFCSDYGFEHLMNVLAVEHGEAPVAMGYLREGPEPTTMVWFTNEKNTRSTIVITKKTKQKESACIVWSGKSEESAFAFSANPSPDFPPEPIKQEGVEL